MSSKFSLLFCLLLFSCAESKSDKPFSKADWSEVWEGGIHPNRNEELNDLVTHHHLNGLTYYQLIDSLGAPDNSDSLSLEYAVTIETSDFTVVKSLVLSMNKDSLVTSWNIYEREQH